MPKYRQLKLVSSTEPGWSLLNECEGNTCSWPMVYGCPHIEKPNIHLATEKMWLCMEKGGHNCSREYAQLEVDSVVNCYLRQTNMCFS